MNSKELNEALLQELRGSAGDLKLLKKSINDIGEEQKEIKINISEIKQKLLLILQNRTEVLEEIAITKKLRKKSDLRQEYHFRKA